MQKKITAGILLYLKEDAQNDLLPCKPYIFAKKNLVFQTHLVSF